MAASLLGGGSRLPVLAAAIALVIATRPPAETLPSEVAKLRAVKRRGKVERDWTFKGHSGSLLKMHRWPDDLWAADALIVSFGCTQRGTCFVGTLGKWWRLPKWMPKWDLWLLAGVHGTACACYMQSPMLYHQLFSPRASAPHTVLLGAFASSNPWELLWIGSTIVGLGQELQRALGRAGFIGLYLVAALASSVCSMLLRCSARGHGGILAAMAYHTILSPRSQHNIFGLTLGARQALAVQTVMAGWPLAGQPVALIGVFGPLLIGALPHLAQHYGWF